MGRMFVSITKVYKSVTRDLLRDIIQHAICIGLELRSEGSTSSNGALAEWVSRRMLRGRLSRFKRVPK